MSLAYVFEYSGRKYVLPEYLVESLERYRSRGEPPGSCLEAALSSRFTDVYMRADDILMENMPALAAYLYHEMPGDAHGSTELYKAWVKAGGLRGHQTEKENPA